MKIRHAVACAALALSTAFVANPARAEWLEVKSRHFTMIGDGPEDILRRRSERMERFDAVMRQILPKSIDSNLPILMVGEPEDVRRLGHLPDGVLAYFRPSPYGVFAVSPIRVSSSSGISAETVMFHEYVHHMLMGSLDDPMPQWMNEGMAELFMNSRLEDDGSVTIGIGNSVRGYSLNRLGRWDATRLFESDRKPTDRTEIDQLYAKGWLVLHYLLFSGNRKGEFAKFTDLLKRGTPQIDAARQAFGDLGKFESELEFYRRRPTLPAVRIPAAQIAAVPPSTVRKLTQAEVEIMPLRFRSMAGVNPAEALDTAAKARPIAARYPDNAFVQRAVAEMEFDAKNYAAADQAIDRAIAANPQYVDAIAIKSILTGARANREHNPVMWRQARALAIRANRIEQDNPLPLMLYFDSFTGAGEAPNPAAVTGLLRAIVLQPSYRDLRVKVGLQFVAQNDLKSARAMLSSVAFAPHQASDNPVAKLVAEFDKTQSPQALLAKAAELKVSASNLFIPEEPTKEDGDKGSTSKPAPAKPADPKPAA